MPDIDQTLPLQPLQTPAPTSIDEVQKKLQETEEKLTTINREIYKKNAELHLRNKTLSILTRLDEIMLAALEVQQVAQQVIDEVVKELAYDMGIVSLLDKDRPHLKIVAVSDTEKSKRVLQELSKPIQDIRINIDDTNNVMALCLKNKTKIATPFLMDLFNAFIDHEQATALQVDISMQTIITYPLYIRGKVLGTLSLGIHREEKDLSIHEVETIEKLQSVIGVAIDKALTYQDLKEANVKLQDLDKLKDEFLSVASHELRTPLTVIRGNVSMIMDGYGGSQVTAKDKQMLQDTYDATVRLIELVNDFLDVSRIEQGRMQLHNSLFDVTSLSRKAVQEVTSIASPKGLTVTYQSNLNAAMIHGDEGKVKQIIMNLLGNSIKFTMQGGITVTQRVDGNMLVTSVKDTGAGIAKDKQGLLFQRYQQAMDKTLARQAGGTGLGLYISRKLAEMMGGQLVLIRSELGSGSEFAFSLPLAQPNMVGVH